MLKIKPRYLLKVATVPTAYGIETFFLRLGDHIRSPKLQQCLPFAVCDEGWETAEEQSDDEVRTSLVPDRRENEKDRVNVPTACGSETPWHRLCTSCLRHDSCNNTYCLRYWNGNRYRSLLVLVVRCNSAYRLQYWNYLFVPIAFLIKCWLQQYLPLVVLKHCTIVSVDSVFRNELLWGLPLAVLKLSKLFSFWWPVSSVATVLTVYGIETRYLNALYFNLGI